ncbi:hypothetical protein SOVF_037920 isoform A [Spinacia oleracea]|uniref:Uncharacterized protein isoform X2 n=1 Tax=Spinacia oleracea TaxID=3562 RepID=A0A9R0JCG3_SPIOL|nr:uncharacterized protein LOC110803416 isoform X2 [Spinacia oleracea]KNA22021.1 hypothetical protein SOVF_037920 isoform A [Spinacia oleracea]
MDDVKKWTVTYTKHVKQKRKVYQDGSLHLLSNNKVMLYDESEQLLDSKFLTKDEAVKPGESLTFASFLVDIGDFDNNCNPTSNANPKPRDKTQMPQREKSRHTFSSMKPNTAGRKTSLVSVSPSQKIIREFKKNEELKYGAHSPKSPGTSSFKEWEALYTTQLTQKAKKYHDGFIRMIYCGSQGRQIMLYDSSKNQIAKRFMKKDEVIDTGGSLTFDSHLVDIGDPMGTNGDDADVKIQERNNAKRSKKSTLLDHVGSGNSGVIGKRRDDACSTKRVNSDSGSFGFDKINQKKNFASSSSLRDANQILSILRKPITQDTISAVEEAPMQQCPPTSSEPVQIHADSQAFDSSLQVDQCPVIKAVEKHNNEKAVDGGQSSTFSEGNCSYLERLCTQGIEILRSNEFESPPKSQPIVGSSVDHGRPIVIQSSKRVESIDNRSVVDSETTIHLQPSTTKLPETDPENKEKTASTKDMSKRFGSLMRMKTKKSVKNEKLNIKMECPSFDLGI